MVGLDLLAVGLGQFLVRPGLITPIDFTAGAPLTSADFRVRPRPTDLAGSLVPANSMLSTELAIQSHSVESV